MKKLLFVASALAALSLLTPSFGYAQADNQVGVYFDLGATETSFTPVAFVEFNIHLLLTQPVDNDSAPVTEVEAYEVTIEFSNGAALIKSSETLPPNALNLGDANSPAAGLNYIVGLAVPVPVENGITWLATIGLTPLNVDENFISLVNSPLGNMYYQEVATKTLVNFYPSSGNSADPVAAISGTVTPVESSTWGGVKSLYR